MAGETIGAAGDGAPGEAEAPVLTLVAIAPVVGRARVVSAARGIGEAFGLPLLPGGVLPEEVGKKEL